MAQAGTGDGSVARSPSATDFCAGTSVTLTATPNPDSAFTGWSGDCTGTGPCDLTMDADKSVTAVFDLKGYSGPFSGSGPVANTNNPCTFSVSINASIALQMSEVGGAVSGSAQVTGNWSAVVTGGESPTQDCLDSSSPFDITAPVSGTTSNIVFSGGSFPVVNFQGSQSGSSITGTATFTFSNTTGSVSGGVTLVLPP